MSLRYLGVAILALLGGTNAADSCCFVVQDQAHEVYWVEYVTDVYTAAVNLTSITTLLTPYPTTTITNYETNIYPTYQVLTTSSLVTENPVALYTNPAYAIPQNTEILSGSTETATGGVTIASPTGFWVYSTAKIFTAPAVTDANGNVACGTLSTFATLPSNTVPAACVPTFTGINSNAAAYFDNNGGQGVEITLTTPFVHVPTRAALQLSPTEACVQGNGTQNYGYPAQELINHLAGNAYYSAQFPGIENCLPAGPSIQAVNALAVAVTAGPLSATLGADPPASTSGDPPASSDPPASNTSSSLVPASVASSTTPAFAPASPTANTGGGGSTESAGGGLTASTVTTVITTATVPPTTTSASSPVTSTSGPGTTSTTVASTTSVPALPDTTSSSPAGVGTESAQTVGLLPSTTSSTSSSSVTSETSTVIVSPLPETSSSSSKSTSSSLVTSPVSIATTSSPSSSSSSSFTSSSTLSSTTSSSEISIPALSDVTTAPLISTAPTSGIPLTSPTPVLPTIITTTSSSSTSEKIATSSVLVNGTASPTIVPASYGGKLHTPGWLMMVMTAVIGAVVAGLW